MSKSLKSSSIWKSCLLLTVLVLAACAQNPATTDEIDMPPRAERPEVAAETLQDSRSESGDGQVGATISGSDYSEVNPVPIVFETLSVRLTEEDAGIIESMKGRILGADRITIRGYCDRNAVENAKEVAIGRGLAVREELLRLGFEPGKIRIRYSTEIRGKHAAEFELHSAS